MQIPCRTCPLRALPTFQSLSPEELAVTEKLKRGELRVEAGMPILSEGSNSPQLFTVLEGQALRFKSLENGERQVLGFVFPGDFIGLQAAVMAEMEHSVTAVTPMLLCVFDRGDLVRLYQDSPTRAFDLTWIAAEEESMLAEALATVGQQGARARVAWGLLRLMDRAETAGLVRDGVAPMPFRQHDLADALGLSVVHTNKTLASLRADGLATLRDRTLTIHDRPRLERLVGTTMRRARTRPLI
ncbi:Crp/Fnr family transcriptional regulator [Citreimonas salinaria]|uniref:cAMP-binding domain of CRP or a regulatory subunit of cAMP-dependent protein kinases n=1 Tax=Citreimonas salinaria TaxID=321339 RepID=A0A1H3H4G1_9RHOB|nr:Crp/Fnr family transcriptional regulator [Citreimonas salinaria]SDY10402.1 cAMP-binding domain of CRP or a regulatory subunit of cAMP-dependent protein kinases [Citreimonas salinaria]